MEDLEKYWRAVRSRVCVKCIDGDGHGNCRLSGEDACGLKLHFPRIVETVLAVQSNTIEPYIEALRQNVCADCKHQSPDGTCMFRSNLDCGLDRYFPLVIEAIESVRLQTENTIVRRTPSEKLLEIEDEDSSQATGSVAGVAFDFPARVT